MTASKLLHYTALILGFQASVFFLFFLITEGGVGLMEGKTNVIPILLMMIFTVGGYVWEVFSPGKGCLIMISGGVLMAIYLVILSGMGEFEMGLIYGLPFIIPGIILYFTKKQKS